MFVSSTKFCLYGSRRLSLFANVGSQLLTPNRCLQKNIFLPLESRHLHCPTRGSFLASYDVKRRLIILHTPYVCSYKTEQKYFPLSPLVPRRYCNNEVKGKEPQPAKQSLIQRFKQMYKDYWYVLLPVHVITSIFWFGGFYYLAKSGVDVIALLESMGFSEKITSRLKDSNAGYFALAYALYKIATPVRYTVTLGGTTVAINYLKEWGYIKPIQTAAQLKRMYTDKKYEFREKGLKKNNERTN